MSLLWTPVSNPSGYCGFKKSWRRENQCFACPSEMLLPSQVTLSTSDCIYLTKAVSSLQGSAVENTGEDGVAQGHPAIGLCFHSTHRNKRK